MAGASDLTGGRAPEEGALLWRPSAARLGRCNLRRFEAWLADDAGLRFDDYEALWAWSVSDPQAFWAAIWTYFGVVSDTPYSQVLSGAMPDCRWFEGAQVNFAEHILLAGAERPDRAALWSASETQPLAALSWRDLAAQVRVVAEALRARGLKPGDRVAAYMPNTPETAIAMLATVAVGGVWAAAAPEFGAKTVIERFGQIAPKFLFVADGYRFGGRAFDRREDICTIAAAIPSLEQVVWRRPLGLPAVAAPGVSNLSFEDLAGGTDPGAEVFRFARVPFDHPLWVLFSSGTTGLPKAIVHSHVGVLVETLKYMHLHLDLGPDSCMFFYTTTGWMIWNSVVSSLIAGGSAVLYDGSPVAGGPEALWRLAEDAGVTLFGASPSLVQMMKAAGLRPSEQFGLQALQAVILSGSPSSAETFQWFYEAVKPDLWVTSQSGGTELCSGLVGGVPTRPVYAGEIQGRMLGMNVRAFSEAGRELVDETGELVVISPAPSMPLRFWGDVGGARYRDTYFSTFPGIWRHGDLLRINRRGGCFIPGRSDATLNRFGVRIGAAEIYSVLERIEGVADALVVCCELPGGGYYMPLFVALAGDHALTGELVEAIRSALRAQASPRHVPDEILQAPAIPYTLTGKKMEVPVRRLLMGAPAEAVASRDSMRDPAALDWFAAFAAGPRMSQLRAP